MRSGAEGFLRGSGAEIRWASMIKRDRAGGGEDAPARGQEGKSMQNYINVVNIVLPHPRGGPLLRRAACSR